MLADVLTSVSQAILQTIYQRCGWNLTINQLCPVDRREQQFEMVAAAHYTRGPIRRVILGCDRELAHHAATRNLPDYMSELEEQDVDLLENTADENHARAGLQFMCLTLQENLVAACGMAAEDNGFLLHDCDSFRVRTESNRNFYARVTTPVGDFYFLADLSQRGIPRNQKFIGKDNYQSKPKLQNPSDDANIIDDVSGVTKVLEELTDFEEDVLLRFGNDPVTASIHHGTIIMEPGYQPGSDLVITSACLREQVPDYDTGQQIVVVFMYREQLLQFTSTIEDCTTLPLTENASLPILRVKAPAMITPGQRRCAFRIVPATRILGSIQVVPADEEPVLTPGKGLSIVVKDLSDNGARVAMTDRTLLSNFKWGSEVWCTFRLPEGYGTAEVRGIIQRMLLYPQQKQQRKAHLGIEFIMDGDQNDRDLEKIRKYIRHQHRDALRGRVAVLPNSI